MQIRKGLNSDLARLEYCDFSFTVSQIATGPFVNNDLKIETLPSTYNKTYELDIQTLENHCVNPDAIFIFNRGNRRGASGRIYYCFLDLEQVYFRGLYRHRALTAQNGRGQQAHGGSPYMGSEHERGGIKAGNPERQRSRLPFLSKLWLYPGRIRSLSLQRVTGKR